MNILFLLKSLEIGGLEVVTSVLANKFVKEGHYVCVYSFLGGEHSIAKRFCEQIKVYPQNDYSVCKDNIQALRKILIDNRVDVIINQWGLPYVPIKVAKKAIEGLDVKIVSVYHSAPSSNGRIQKVNLALSKCNNVFQNICLRFKRRIFQIITSASMRYVYENSNLYLVLSDNYVDEFRHFTHRRNLNHLMVQTNPVTINTDGFRYVPNCKTKEIIYIGRLEVVVKRVDRIIDTWSHLEKDFPDWRLTIVGSGDDKARLEKQVQELDLQRVSFVGFQMPAEYYKRASILMLASDFEGFPLVLPECMSFGVIPAVYDSYAAVGDIIEDGKNGIVIPYHHGNYDAKEAADLLSRLMKDDALREHMAHGAMEKSEEFSIDTIYEEWMGKLYELTNK